MANDGELMIGKNGQYRRKTVHFVIEFFARLTDPKTICPKNTVRKVTTKQCQFCGVVKF